MAWPMMNAVLCYEDTPCTFTDPIVRATISREPLQKRKGLSNEIHRQAQHDEVEFGEYAAIVDAYAADR